MLQATKSGQPVQTSIRDQRHFILNAIQPLPQNATQTISLIHDTTRPASAPSAAQPLTIPYPLPQAPSNPTWGVIWTSKNDHNVSLVIIPPLSHLPAAIQAPHTAQIAINAGTISTPNRLTISYQGPQSLQNIKNSKRTNEETSVESAAWNE
jgi:hypothetical protein